MNNSVLPKLRTVNQLYDDIHDIDPNSPVSKNFIKKIIIENNVSYISVGVKKMYDENIIFEYISKSFKKSEKTNIFYHFLSKTKGIM